MTHMYFSARAEGIRTFRHALRAAYRTAISAAQILVLIIDIFINRLYIRLVVFVAALTISLNEQRVVSPDLLEAAFSLASMWRKFTVPEKFRQKSCAS